MYTNKISLTGILFVLAFMANAQVGINTEDPQATLDVNGSVIIRDVPSVTKVTDKTKIMLIDTSAEGDFQVVDTELTNLNVQSGATIYSAEKNGSWSLLDLNLGNSWYPIEIKGATDTKIGDKTIFNDGVYSVRESGIYVVNFELQFESGVNLELLGGKSLGLLRNGVVEEQKVLDGIRVSLLGITLASVPVTSTNINTMLVLEKGDNLTFAINSKGILPVDLGLLKDSKISIYVYKLSNPI